MFRPTCAPPVETKTVERYLNELNSALLDALQRGGDLFVSNAVIRGRYVLRACIVNFHTDASDVEAVSGIVATLGRCSRRRYAGEEKGRQKGKIEGKSRGKRVEGRSKTEPPQRANKRKP